MWSTVSQEGKDLISQLLKKNPKHRMKIEEVLEHPWIVGSDINIIQLRRKSNENADEIMKFVAYSNVDLDKIKENSPKAAQSSMFMAQAAQAAN